MDDEPIILGQQLADARKAEAERLARGDGAPSPLTSNDRYDAWRGDFDLYNPVPLPLDDRLRSLCHKFASLDDVSRAATRQSLSMDDFYTLWAFSRRAAVFGLRRRDVDWLIDGLTASAMIEIARIDWRDAPGPPGLIWAMFDLIGVDAVPSFMAAAALAAPEIAELLSSFPDRPPAHKALKAWGYELVHSAGGPGLLRRSTSSYAPTMPIAEVAIQIAGHLRNDQYSADVDLATKLPDIWLSKIDDRALATALKSVVAGASIHGRLRPTARADHQSLGIMAFLVETSTSSAAETLHRIARLKQQKKHDFVLVAASHGRLFCVLIARNFMHGGPSFETSDSMQRFVPGLEQILQECPASSVLPPLDQLFGRVRRFFGR